MAFIRRRGDAYYLVHNLRHRGKVKQLHLARLGEQPTITPDLIRQVNRSHPLLDIDWDQLEERTNARARIFDFDPDLVKKLSSLLEDFGETLPDLRMPVANILLVPAHNQWKVFLVRPDVGAQLVTRPDSEAAVPYFVVPTIRTRWKKLLDHFEEMIGDPTVKEEELQTFFERHPELLMGLDYKQVVPHPLLQREQGEGPLIPDFFLQPIDGKFGDILDLKLPTEPVMVGDKNRLRFSAAVREAFAQVREYRDYFEDPSRRESVRERYGLTAYRPSVGVVIGRTPYRVTEEHRKQIGDELPSYLKLITYDELFSKMKRFVEVRSRW